MTMIIKTKPIGQIRKYREDLDVTYLFNIFRTSHDLNTANTFSEAFDEKIRPLMDKIDQIRSLFAPDQYGITFPSVVVVGDQSSGKSTLLEALSLVELPKGSGIVTRCPLVLRLRRSDRRQVYRLEGNKKIPLDETNLNIMRYIEDETIRLAGNHKNVVSEMIELQVEDPTARDLTVVDLPGIARNPIAGQPSDIHQQTTKLIRHFIEQKGSVILSVFPANVDVATVESLALARAVDPEGLRTIGVITKTDLAPNRDKLIQQLLMDRADVFQLKLGFVAVRNRSTEEDMSLRDARTREREFFSTYPASVGAESKCLGIEALIDRLANLYAERVRETFPKIQSDVAKQLKDVREQLSKLPPDLQSTQSRLVKYHDIVSWYVDKFLPQCFVNSTGGQNPSIINVLHHKFGQVEKVIERENKDFYSPQYRVRVGNAMSACFGEQLPNFLPHPVLKRFIVEKIDAFWRLIEVLVEESFQIVHQRILDNDRAACNGEVLSLKLLPTLRGVVKSYLTEKKQLVRQQFEEMIRLEKLEPYTLNHYYMNKINQFRDYEAERRSQNPTHGQSVQRRTDDHEEKDDTRLFQSLSNDDYAAQDMVLSIYAYWKLLVKRLLDNIALTLRAACVFDTCAGINDRLRQLPTKQEGFVDQYLAEDEAIRLRRQRLLKQRDQLEKVDAILGDGLRDIDDEASGFISGENAPPITLDQLVENINAPR